MHFLLECFKVTFTEAFCTVPSDWLLHKGFKLVIVLTSVSLSICVLDSSHGLAHIRNSLIQKEALSLTRIVLDGWSNFVWIFEKAPTGSETGKRNKRLKLLQPNRKFKFCGFRKVSAERQCPLGNVITKNLLNAIDLCRHLTGWYYQEHIKISIC